MDAREAARTLAARRQLRDLVCQRCGKAFTARDAKARYCGGNCRQLAWLKRKRQEAKAAAAPGE